MPSTLLIPLQPGAWVYYAPGLKRVLTIIGFTADTWIRHRSWTDLVCPVTIIAGWHLESVGLVCMGIGWFIGNTVVFVKILKLKWAIYSINYSNDRLP